jgi:antitoxin CptB
MSIAAPLKAKLIWQCRRGMLELDLMLNHFVSQYLEQLTPSQLAAFEQLLSYPDPDIYLWLMGSEDPSKQELVDIVSLIQSHHRI